MKIGYDREQDIMLVELSPDDIDYAEEMGPVVVHFTREGKPVLLEIMDASDFLTTATKITMRATGRQPVEVGGADHANLLRK